MSYYSFVRETNVQAKGDFGAPGASGLPVLDAVGDSNNWIVATTLNYQAIGVKNCTLIGECSIDSRRMSRSNHVVA